MNDIRYLEKSIFLLNEMSWKLGDASVMEAAGLKDVMLQL